MYSQDIDYKRVLDFLQTYHGARYSNPDNQGMEDGKKQDYLKLKEQAQSTISEMKKIGEKCKESYNLDHVKPFRWLEMSNIKVREYLWMQFKFGRLNEADEFDEIHRVFLLLYSRF